MKPNFPEVSNLISGLGTASQANINNKAYMSVAVFIWQPMYLPMCSSYCMYQSRAPSSTTVNVLFALAAPATMRGICMRSCVHSYKRVLRGLPFTLKLGRKTDHL